MNLKELAENLGLEEAEYLELIELLIETGTSDIEKLQHAIGEGNAEEVASIAHSIKGAAGNLGFSAFCHAAKQIEDDARQGILERAADGAHELKKNLEEISALARR